MSRIGRHWYSATLIIALSLRLVNLGGPSLWYDECLTARMTWLVNPAQIAAGTSLDVHPPLYYLLVAGWRQAAGSSEFALRFPSVIFGVVTLMLWRRIGERLKFSPPSTIALGLGLMAVSPSLIFYSQETRMYSLLTLAVSVAAWGIISKSSAWLIVGGAVAMYSQNMAWAYMFSLGILALALGWPLRKLALASGIIALLYLPWLSRLLAQISELNNGYWVPPLSIGGIAYSIYPLTWFFALPNWGGVHGGLLALGLAVLAIWKSLPSWRQTYPVLACWLGPMAATAVASWLWQPMYFYRPMMAVTPPMLFLIAHSLTRISKRNAILIAMLTLPLLTLTLYRQFSDERGLRQPERDNAQILIENWQPGDCVFHMNVGSTITMLYYMPDYPQFIWAGPAALYNGALSVKTQKTLLLDRREFEELPTTCTRVWLEWWTNPLTSEDEDTEARRLIARYNGKLFHTFVSNDMVEAGAWILEGPHEN